VTRLSRRRSRELALQALYAWQLGGGDALEQLRLLEHGGEAEGGLAGSLVRGVHERAEELRGMIAPCLDRDFGRLSPVERETALLLLKGYGHKEIAGLQEKSERTVRQHAVAVYRKSGLSGRAELSAFFLEDLLLPADERADPGKAGA